MLLLVCFCVASVLLLFCFCVASVLLLVCSRVASVVFLVCSCFSSVLLLICFCSASVLLLFCFCFAPSFAPVLFLFCFEDLLEMWKADIDSAFRRLPVKAAHRDLAWVAWRVDETRLATARHFGMPFGAVASVHYWDRVGQCLRFLFQSVFRVFASVRSGALLTSIARRVLHIPVMRYVDDFFSVSRAGTAKCAMSIFARWALWLDMCLQCVCESSFDMYAGLYGCVWVTQRLPSAN